MYTVYVVIKKGIIDFAQPIVPTRVHHCLTIEDAYKKKEEEEDLFWEHAGRDNCSMFGCTMGRFFVTSYNTNEQILIEIVDK